jgi:hypothetical protein
MDLDTMRIVITALMWLTIPGAVASLILLFVGTKERDEFFWHVVTYAGSIALVVSVWALGRLLVDHLGSIPGWYPILLVVSFVTVPVAVYWRLSLQTRSLLRKPHTDVSE